MKIGIINGPNLNLLGKRKPEIYGRQSFGSYLEELGNLFPEHEIFYFQSNSEGALIDKLHDWGFDLEGIVLNPAAYTHTSIAIADAVEAIPCPVVEVHISDLSKREKFRQISYVREQCIETFSGLGLQGYEKAIRSLLKRQVQ